LNKAECNHIFKQVALISVGKYVAYPSIWYHHGYYIVQLEKVFFTAQLFAKPDLYTTSKPLTCQSTSLENYIEGWLEESNLDRLTKDLFLNWDTTYSGALFPPCNFLMVSGWIVQKTGILFRQV
jgi:hypothetical protein